MNAPWKLWFAASRAAQEESTGQDVQHALEGVAGALGVSLADVLQRVVQSLAVALAAWVAYRLLKVLTRRLQAHFDRDDIHAR